MSVFIQCELVHVSLTCMAVALCVCVSLSVYCVDVEGVVHALNI